MNDALNLDLTVCEVAVNFGEKRYTLREASEAQVQAYTTKMAAIGKIVDGEFAGVDPNSPSRTARGELVASCLRDPGNRPVAPVEVLSWPHRVTSKLFERLREISEMEDDSLESLQRQRQQLDKRIARLERDSLGNAPGTTPDGSDCPSVAASPCAEEPGASGT